MAYCEICDSNTCSGFHPLGGRVCEHCGEALAFKEGLCRGCLLSDGETRRERIIERCTKCPEYRYAEGLCFIHYTYRRG